MTDTEHQEVFLEYAGEEGTGEKDGGSLPIKFGKDGIGQEPPTLINTKPPTTRTIGPNKEFMDFQAMMEQRNSINVPLKMMLTREFKFLQMVNPQIDIDMKQATEGSAGIDLFACIKEQICLNRMGEREVIPTGIHIELPLYWEAQVRPRSGLAAKNGITVTNSPGTIDSDYRGEIKVILHNTSSRKFWVRPGDRIAQLVLKPVWLPVIEYVDELSDTDRGEGGFGSTGS